MTVSNCAQTPLVEAWQDGRLGPQERASLERHIATCGACAEQRRVLAAIRSAVREPISEATPLAHQRARGALLRRATDLGANAHVDRGMRGRVATFAIAAAFAIVALAVGWSWGRSSAPVAATSARPPIASVETAIVPANGARFERSRVDGLDTVTLSSGTLAITAAAPKAGERFLVRTEDAELESKGSSFRVEADNGKIRSVVVERGMVDVRYAGFIAVIPAGGSWHANESKAADVTGTSAPATAAAAAPSAATSPTTSANATPPSDASRAATPPPAVVAALPRAAHPRTADSPAQATPVAIVASAPSPVDITPPPAPRNDFSNAMRALERGDYENAATTLQDFADAHPSDARADEADYIRAIALQRAGRAADAKAAAHLYLSKWPKGAHRRDAERLAND